MVNLTFAQEMGHAAETKERELFKMVVGLQDVAYLDDGLFVLVCNAARVMQTLRVVDLAVRCSKVDCDGERHLPSGSQILDEVWIFCKHEVFEENFSTLLSVSVQFEFERLGRSQVLYSSLGITNSLAVNQNYEANR